MKVDTLADAPGSISVGPFERNSSFVVVAEVAHDLALEISLGAKDAAGDDFSLELGEPELHLVEPGGIGGREVQVNLRMLLQESLDRLGFVGRKIVEDHLDLPSRGLSRDDIGKESHEFRTGVSGRRLAQDLSAGGVQGGVEREGAMAKVFKAVPFRSPRREWEHRVEPVEGLNRGLLVDAENRRMRGGLEVKTNDGRRLGLEGRIVTCHVVAAAMGLQSRLGPDPCDSDMSGAQSPCQRTGAPMSRAVGWFSVQRPVENARFEFHRAGSRQPSTVSAVESAKSLGGKAIPPELHGLCAAAKSAADLPHPFAGGQRQQDPTAPHFLGFARPTPAAFHQFSALGWTKTNLLSHASRVACSCLITQ